MDGANYPVRVSTTTYRGPGACSRCGKQPLFRVVGIRGELKRELLLCQPCFKVFQQEIKPFYGQ